MPDCQMCWNEWQTLERTPLPQLSDEVQVCRNCSRSMKQVVSFARHHGADLTGATAPVMPYSEPSTGQEESANGATAAKEAETADDGAVVSGAGENPPSPRRKK